MKNNFKIDYQLIAKRFAYFAYKHPGYKPPPLISSPKTLYKVTLKADYKMNFYEPSWKVLINLLIIETFIFCFF